MVEGYKGVEPQSDELFKIKLQNEIKELMKDLTLDDLALIADSLYYANNRLGKVCYQNQKYAEPSSKIQRLINSYLKSKNYLRDYEKNIHLIKNSFFGNLE